MALPVRCLLHPPGLIALHRCFGETYRSAMAPDIA